VFVSLPDDKDIAQTTAWLDAHMRGRWMPVKPAAAEHLSYATWDRPVVPWSASLARNHRRIVAAGSWSFIAEVLAMLEVENEVAFEVNKNLVAEAPI